MPRKTKSSRKKQSKTLATPKGPLDPNPRAWAASLGIQHTGQVPVPGRLIDQIIGQDEAVAVALKAAAQRRHLLLIGDPGTGKSMLAKAMTEVLPRSQHPDLLAEHNPKNPNEPIIRGVPGGTARQELQLAKKKARRSALIWRIVDYAVVAAAMVFGLWMWIDQNENPLFFLFIILLALLYLYFSFSRKSKSEVVIPKLLIENPPTEQLAPFVDATGGHAGALLGDVRHDPYQAGGLETPAHHRVEIGAIHRANQGVLFIDEINVLKLPSQQALLTAIQERQYAIVGQSQSSAGAMVKTQPVPCNFILVAAGNLDAVQNPEESMTGETGMHPALRSRIRGYGYEVFVNHVMDDTHENRLKLLQFVAQEVVRDGKIPQFTIDAAAEVIREAQRRSGQTGKLTLRLRELGGLVRTAGDLARSSAASLATLEHVRRAKLASRSLEQQITFQEIRRKTSAVNITSEGAMVGFAYGTAFIGTGEVGEPAGLIVPVEAAIVPALGGEGGNLRVGQAIEEVRHPGIQNVASAIKTLRANQLRGKDIHIEARVNHPEADAEGVVLAATVASLSALERRPVRQDVVFVGSISVRGQLRPVEYALQQIEAALDLGFRAAIVPAALKGRILLDDAVEAGIDVIYVDSLQEATQIAFSAPAMAASSTASKASQRAAGGKA
jgi:ATP-dependent Lon protease